MIIQFFYELFYRPLFNALVFLYGHIAFADLGIAIIALTILIRIVLYPVFQKSVRNQAVMQKIQPDIRRVQKQNKNNKEKQVRELMELYRAHNVNPFSGILLLLIQLPILISLYRVFLSGLTPESFSALYSFVPLPESVDFTFLNLINLKNRSIIIVALAVTAQFFQGKLALSQNRQSRADRQEAAKNNRQEGGVNMENIGRQMVMIAPGITLIVLWGLPSAVGLYWLVSSLFSIAQQIVINRQVGAMREHGKEEPKINANT